MMQPGGDVSWVKAGLEYARVFVDVGLQVEHGRSLGEPLANPSLKLTRLSPRLYLGGWAESGQGQREVLGPSRRAA
jgi:hypothetical protein